MTLWSDQGGMEGTLTIKRGPKDPWVRLLTCKPASPAAMENEVSGGWRYGMQLLIQSEDMNTNSIWNLRTGLHG